MLKLIENKLQFKFPSVHPRAVLNVEFKRTLRIPDDGTSYPLTPGLGNFPLVHVDDFADKIPTSWQKQGGVILPMYQSEAMWIKFSSSAKFGGASPYPFAVRIAAGKINAINGQPWGDSLDAKNQNYVVVPDQPWLDGFCVEPGLIQQFVAMPLGGGHTIEEQLTGEAKFGGLQLEVTPMKAGVYAKRRAESKTLETSALSDEQEQIVNLCYLLPAPEMGLGKGGRMRQQVYDDKNKSGDWDTSQAKCCFVQIANSQTWRDITGSRPPTKPMSPAEYVKHGLPWFDFYKDEPVVGGSNELKGTETVPALNEKKGVEMEDISPLLITQIKDLSEKLASDEVRVGCIPPSNVEDKSTATRARIRYRRLMAAWEKLSVEQRDALLVMLRA